MVNLKCQKENETKPYLLSDVSFFNFSIKLFTLAGFLFFLPSCYEKQETCLDIRATNFDFDGDIACTDCCEYPDLKLEFQHREVLVDDTLRIGFSGTHFDSATDSVYFDGNQQPFRIKSIKYFISNIRLVATDGEEAQINEEIEIQTASGLQSFKDDFLRVNGSSSSTLTAGSFSVIKSYDKVKFWIGLDEDIDTANPATLPGDHVLSVSLDSSMYDFQNGHYLGANVEIYQDTIATDTVAVELPIVLPGNEPIEVELSFPESVLLPEGFHFEITLLINCPSWFDDANVKGSPSILIEKIVSKLSNSISLLEVKVENN